MASIEPEQQNLKRKRQQTRPEDAIEVNIAERPSDMGSLLNGSHAVGLGISAPGDTDEDQDHTQMQSPTKRRKTDASSALSRSSDALKTTSTEAIDGTRAQAIDRRMSNLSSSNQLRGKSMLPSVTQDAWVLQRDMTAKEQERFKETITANFSTRILYKHNELRLIDQEIAKCQAALEQLRRCGEIPYPSTTGLTNDMVNVSTGSGPALIAGDQTHPALSPAPWGVTDGPYTRHYAQWLLSDPTFDGATVSQPLAATQSAAEAATRTRGSQGGMESVLTSGRSRTQRGSGNTVLQALPSGYAQPKPERSAQVIKRQADGMFVKLVCPGMSCGEERFNSVQGFINHCRIKHQIHFATHEDAAQRAGTTHGVDQKLGAVTDRDGVSAPQDKSSSMIAISQGNGAQQSSPQTAAELVFEHVQPDRRNSTDALKPQSPTAFRSFAAPASSAQSSNMKPSTGSEHSHPYNRPALDTVREWSEHRPMASSPKSSSRSISDRQRRQSNMGPPISPGFVGSEQLPFLSERFAHAGRAGNLQVMVDEARDRFDLDNVYVPEDSVDAENTSSQSVRSRVPKKHETVGGLGAPLMDRRPGSKKGLQLGRVAKGDMPDDALEQEEVPFLSSPRSRRQRGKHELSRSHDSMVRRDVPQSDELRKNGDFMALDEPGTPSLDIAFEHRCSMSSTSPLELSPGAHHATDTNQAPSLVSDDGQSGSEYEGDEDQDDDDTPKPEDVRAHISFHGSVEIMAETGGPSGLAVDEKMGEWGGTSRSSRSQRAR